MIIYYPFATEAILYAFRIICQLSSFYEIILFLNKISLLIKANMLINNHDVVRKVYFV